MKKKLLITILPIFILVFMLFTTTNNYSYAETTKFTQANGGFSAPSEIIAYDNYLFVCDTGNNRLQIIDQSTLNSYSFGEAGYTNESTTALTHIACDNQYIYLCIGDSYYIKKFDYNGTYISVNNQYYPDGSTSSTAFNKIASLAMDTYGNLYALHMETNMQDSRLLVNKGERFETIAISGLALQEDSRLLMSASSDYIIIVDSTKIQLINARNYTLDKTIAINQTFTDVKIDHLDNLYFLNAGVITKLIAGSYTTSETLSVPGLTSTSLFAFNQVNGEIFFIDNTQNKVFKINMTGIDHLSAFTKPTDYLDTSVLNKEQVKIATLVSGTIAYNYPYTLSSNISLNTGDFVIVLDDNISENSNFYYCLITSKKDYNLSVYIHKNHLNMVDPTITNLENENLLYSPAISSPTANIYKFPTSLKASDSIDSAIVYSSSHLNSGDKITAVRFLKDYKDKNGYSFYEVRFSNGDYGYVNSNAIYQYNAEKQPTKIKANATVLTSDEKAFVNLYTRMGDEYVLIKDFVLLDGTRVRLVHNFNKTAEYTEVKYVEDGVVKTAFVKTKFVQVDGISFEIIIAILLTVLCVLFSLILYVVVRKNKKAMK